MTFQVVLKKFYTNASERIMASSRVLSCLLEDKLKYCPECLKEKPYYHLLWQVKEINVCPKHKVQLIDKCPFCNEEIPLLAKDSEIGICPTCSYSLTENTKRVGLDDSFYNDRVIKDWGYLLNPKAKLIPELANVEETQALAIALIYVCLGQGLVYSKDKLQKSGINPKSISALLQTARGTRVNKNSVHLEIVLSILRMKGLTCFEFSKLEIPKNFILSLLGKPTRIVDRYACKAPWCSHYNKPGSLEKTGTSKKIRKNGHHLNYYMYCRHCLMEYAVDATNNDLIERGYFISLAWHKVRPLLLQEKGLKEIANSLGLSKDRVLRSIMFLVANSLVKESIAGFYKPIKKDESIIQTMKRAIKEGTNIKKVWKAKKWSYKEFLYYWLSPEVRRQHIKSKQSRPCKRGDAQIRKQKVKEALERLIQQDETITISKVSSLIGVNNETIRLWGGLPIIKEGKRLQKLSRWKNQKTEWINKVNLIIDQLQAQKLHIDSDTIYAKLGVKRTVLVRDFPEVTSYIGRRLKEIRQKKHQEKIQVYRKAVQQAIIERYSKGLEPTQAEIAADIGLSLSGFSRYSVLIDEYYRTLNNTVPIKNMIGDE